MSAIAYGQVFGRKHNNEQRLVDEEFIPLGKKKCLRCGKVKDDCCFPPLRTSRTARLDVCKICLDLEGEKYE